MGSRLSQDDKRKSLLSMEIPTEELLKSLNPLNKDYYHNSLKKIGDGGQGTIFKVKCRND
jgi:hypothetical protein